MNKDLLLDFVNYYLMYASDVVTADGTDIFRNNMPDDLDNCVGIFEFLGVSDFTSNVGNRSIQVMLRNTDYDTAKEKIWSLFDLIYKPESDVRIVNLTATRWAIIKARNFPYLLQQDETGRFIFMFIMGVVTYRDE